MIGGCVKSYVVMVSGCVKSYDVRSENLNVDHIVILEK